MRALTGVDTDRLPAEKARGITIELGFAPLTLPSGLLLGVVDVPGHESLVRTMVQGAAAGDLVLPVVAADAGVMPQTREHLAICKLLGLGFGALALTRCDLVDEETAELAEAEAAEVIAQFFAPGAMKIVRTSALRGEGIAELASALDEAAARAAEARRASEAQRGVGTAHAGEAQGGVAASTRSAGATDVDTVGRSDRPRPLASQASSAGPDDVDTVGRGDRLRPLASPARLWIDRVFEKQGFGVVVTGTLTGAPLERGQEVALLPGGKPARIRGLQHFGEAAQQALPGSRCAVNLQGVQLRDVARGMQLAPPQALQPTRVFDAALEWLPSAPPLGKDPLPALLLVGTAACAARVALIGETDAPSGAPRFARVHLDSAEAALLPGDRFILRGFARSPEYGATLGGGEVLDTMPARRRRSDPALLRELEGLQQAPAGAGLLLRVERAGLCGMEHAALGVAVGIGANAVQALLTELEAQGEVVLARSLALSRAAQDEIETRLLRALSEYHDQAPHQPGMPREALRGALPENVARAAFEQALARLQQRGALETEQEWVRAPDHVARLSRQDEVLAASIRANAMIAGLTPPTVAEQCAEFDVTPERMQGLLAHLERDGSLLRAPGDLWFDRGAVEELREKVIDYLERHGEITPAAYKALVGASRKFVVPLMELFDEQRLTRRRGELRVLRPDADRKRERDG